MNDGTDVAPAPIRLETPHDGVALLTIDRAERFNTLSVETLEALDATLRTLASNPATKALVVTGAGGESFAAGANIREFATLDVREALAFAARGQRVFDFVERAPFAVFAAIDGYCMGGGLDLALACDVRVASPRSIFAHPGARLGILTGFGGTQRLPRLVGKAFALELFVTARRVGAAEALAFGLVDRLADDPVASAVAAASDVADGTGDEPPLKAEAIRAWRRARVR
jgi:enoyl-CoA hydratase